MSGLTSNGRQIAMRGVFSFKVFKIISVFYCVQERDLGESIDALLHTLQYSRSLP